MTKFIDDGHFEWVNMGRSVEDRGLYHRIE